MSTCADARHRQFRARTLSTANATAMNTSARSAYFFPHALAPGTSPPEPPGRVPFDVEAEVSDGTTTWTEKVKIYGDGYAPNTIGPNQDPCVVAAPKPFHSFCRIDGAKISDEYVRNTKQSLPQCVRPGDLIIYGKFEPQGTRGPTRAIWVDTVLVVESNPRWSTSQRPRREHCPNSHCKGRQFSLRNPSAFAAQLTGQLGGAATAAYIYSLSEAEPNGYHCCTSRGDYRVIVGCANPDASAMRSLQASFAPLARVDAVTGESLGPTSVGEADLGTDWPRVSAFIDDIVRTNGAGPHGSWIARFEEFEVAEVLCRAVIAASRLGERTGVVAALPVRLLQPAARVR